MDLDGGDSPWDGMSMETDFFEGNWQPNVFRCPIKHLPAQERRQRRQHIWYV
jgi:hypothetical protein